MDFVVTDDIVIKCQEVLWLLGLPAYRVVRSEDIVYFKMIINLVSKNYKS